MSSRRRWCTWFCGEVSPCPANEVEDFKWVRKYVVKHDTYATFGVSCALQVPSYPINFRPQRTRNRADTLSWMIFSVLDSVAPNMMKSITTAGSLRFSPIIWALCVGVEATLISTGSWLVHTSRCKLQRAGFDWQGSLKKVLTLGLIRAVGNF